jgi:DNA replication initiation complex subunit (GINS family)
VNDEKKFLKDIKAKIMQKKAKVIAAKALKAKKKKARQEKVIKREKVLFIVWV